MDYQNEVSRDVPPEVREAARLTIWLIGDCDETFTQSLKVSTKKFGAKVAPVKKIVKSILPAGYLRKKTAARMSPEIKEAIKTKKIAEHEAKKFQKNEEPQPEIVIVEEKSRKLGILIPEESARKYKAYAALKGETMSAIFLKMFNKALSDEG
jgi:hypothetical protein